MKRFAPVIIAALLIAGAILYGRQLVPNPDPNHTHADFAVWVNGTKLDFSGPEFMSEAYDPNGREVRVDPMRKYLHLHDGNGHVAHRHKPGLTFGEFLKSLGFTFETRIATDDTSKTIGCLTFPDGRKLCDGDSPVGWQVLVNNASPGCRRESGDIVCGGPDQPSYNPKSDVEEVWQYVFEDGDQILISYGPFFGPGEEGISPDTPEMRREWKLMTNDACMFSKTCPWRGEPPTEGCIADPEVPCVAP